MPTLAILGAGAAELELADHAARAGWRVELVALTRRESGTESFPDCAAQTPLPVQPESHLAAEAGFFSKSDADARAARAFEPAGAGQWPAASAPLPAGSVTLCPTLEQALARADLVVDGSPDELESRMEILLLFDRMAPTRALLLSPLRRLEIADLARVTARPGQCIAILGGWPETTPRSAVHLCAAAPLTEGDRALIHDFWHSIGRALTLDEPTAG